MDNEQEKEKQEQEQQELQWGEARAQMRITLEIFFVEGGIKLHVKSGEDDILSDNKSVYFLRKMTCEKIGKAVDNIVEDVCKAAAAFAYIMKDSQNPKIAETAAGFVDLFGLKDEQNEPED